MAFFAAFLDDLISLFFELFELSLESLDDELLLLELDEELDLELLELDFDELDDELLSFFLFFFLFLCLLVDFLCFLSFLSFFLLSFPDLYYGFEDDSFTPLL